MEILKEFDDLPAMPTTNIPNWNSLEIRGLVGEPSTLDLATLSSLPQSIVIQDFQCNDGWICRDQKWEGVAVRSFLEK
jgi:DMSO/TMAO reductase YedYZ molybdopterin-dependent catalytic subunit